MANIRTRFNPSTFYHIYNKAVGEESVFYEDKNFSYFLSKVDLFICPIVNIYAFCLMPNHFHLLVKTKDKSFVNNWWLKIEEEKMNEAKLENKEYSQRIFNYQKVVAHQFGTLQNSYTKSLNKLYNRKGGLFMQSIHRKEITTKNYLKRAINYIHQNPVQHGFCQTPVDWKYSSYNAYISNKPTRVSKEEGLAFFGSKSDFVKYSSVNEEVKYSIEMDLYY